MMKFCFRLLLPLFLLLPTRASGQLIREYGFKAAYTSSGIMTDNADYENRSGFCLALFVEGLNISIFALQAQLEYNQRGFVSGLIVTSETGEFVQEVKANTRLDYISLPILARIYPMGRRLGHYVMAGPRIDYLAHHRNGVFKFTQVDLEDIVADYFTDFVIGASFGTGLILPLRARSRITMELRYNLDFTDSWADIETREVRNRSVDFWLGFSLSHGTGGH
jgi:hypothetical protein